MSARPPATLATMEVIGATVELILIRCPAATGVPVSQAARAATCASPVVTASFEAAESELLPHAERVNAPATQSAWNDRDPTSATVSHTGSNKEPADRGHIGLDALCGRSVRGVTGADAIDRTLQAIREHGGRVTDQRRAILRVLFDESDHVTAEDLAGRVQSALPEVHITTVYRFLDTLEQMGLVAHVHLGHGPAAFHLTTHRHAHVVCDDCGSVEEIDSAMFDRWSSELQRATGFRLTEQHFALAGRCPTCARGRLAPG